MSDMYERLCFMVTSFTALLMIGQPYFMVIYVFPGCLFNAGQLGGNLEI